MNFGNRLKKSGLMSNKTKRDYMAKLFQEDSRINEIVKKAVEIAIKKHKQLRQSIATWNGKEVVVLKHNEISLKKEEDNL